MQNKRPKIQFFEEIRQNNFLFHLFAIADEKEQDIKNQTELSNKRL